MRRILVTGAAGFLGHHLCRRLLADGAYVIGVDNYYTGSEASTRELATLPMFEMIRHDVTMPLYVEVDEIYNLACPASPKHYQRDPVSTVKTSVAGALNMLGLAKRTGARILQASTSEVYGDPQVSPQVETYWGNVNPTGERACYDEGKRCAETLFYDYRRQHGVNVRVARIFNTYGPRMARDDGRVVSNFVVAALEGRPLEVYGDGYQTRSFCYVDDLIDGLVKLMQSDVWGPVNLGNPEEVTMNGLASRIVAATRSASVVVQKALPADDPRTRCPDIGRAKLLLGWSPTTALSQGLDRTIEYFRAISA